MTSGTLAIILIAAVSHAVWNIASKGKRGDTYLFVFAYTLLSAVLCLPLGIVTSVYGAHPLSWSLLIGAAASAVLHVLYSLVLQLGYDHSDLSVVYPVARGVGPLLTMTVAITVLGERPGVIPVLGAIVVLGGIAIVTGNPFRGSARATPAPFIWGGATGALIATYTLWDSYSITTLKLAPTTYFAATLIIEAILLAPRAVIRRAGIRTSVTLNRKQIPIVAVLSPLAYILILTALQTVPVAIVAPLRESSIVFGALLAWWLFHEEQLGRRITGALIVLAGIALISLA
jgi:drug/metabolite transporter (DMT)-like permease